MGGWMGGWGGVGWGGVNCTLRIQNDLQTLPPALPVSYGSMMALHTYTHYHVCRYTPVHPPCPSPMSIPVSISLSIILSIPLIISLRNPCPSPCPLYAYLHSELFGARNFSHYARPLRPLHLRAGYGRRRSARPWPGYGRKLRERGDAAILVHASSRSIAVRGPYILLVFGKL